MPRPGPPRDSERGPRTGCPRAWPLGRRECGPSRRARGSKVPSRRRAGCLAEDLASTLEAAAFGQGVTVWRGGAMGAGSGVELANGCQRKQSGGPPASRALSWDFHPSGTGPGQRPRAGQGPCRGPAAAPLAGASQAPWRQGEGWGREPRAPAPEVAYSLGDPGPSCSLTGLQWPHLYSGLPIATTWAAVGCH